MNRSEQIMQMVFDAIGECNQDASPDRVLEASSELVLIGEGSKLDSLAFINLVVTLVDNIERTFGTPFDLTNVLEAAEPAPCTVESLSHRIAERLNGVLTT